VRIVCRIGKPPLSHDRHYLGTRGRSPCDGHRAWPNDVETVAGQVIHRFGIGLDAAFDGAGLKTPDFAPNGPIYLAMRLYWPKTKAPSILPQDDCRR
jgi:hypothetical protein